MRLTRLISVSISIGPKRQTKTVSLRVFSIFLWLFIIGISMTYVASLVSLLQSSASTKPLLPFTTFSEMVDHDEVEFSGPTSLRLDPNNDIHRKLDHFINSRHTYYTDYRHAVRKVQQGDGSFAAIVGGLTGEHVTNTHCDLMLLNDQLYIAGYGFACKANSNGRELCANISMAILRLIEGGTMTALENKWWSQELQCPDVPETDYASPKQVVLPPFTALNVEDISFTLVILALGIVLAAAIACFEQKKNGHTAASEAGTV